MHLESYEIVPTPDGRVTIAGTVRFSDPWDAARFLVYRLGSPFPDLGVRLEAESGLALR
jgi:hypothetical protein